MRITIIGAFAGEHKASLGIPQKQDGEKEILNTTKEFHIRSGSVVIDNNINSSENYTRDEYVYNQLFNMKRVTFVDGIPYLHRNDGTKVQTLALHFQGGAKRYMKFYAGSCKKGRALYYFLATASKIKRVFLN